MVVSRSSWARSCCSSSGTSRKVPSCAERRRGKAVTGPHQPEHGTRAWESGPSAEEPPLGPPGVQRQGGAGRGEGGWGSPRAQRYSPPLTCCLWEPESWASVLASTAASPLGEGFGDSSGGRNGRSGLRTATSNFPTRHSHLGHLLFRRNALFKRTCTFRYLLARSANRPVWLSLDSSQPVSPLQASGLCGPPPPQPRLSPKCWTPPAPHPPRRPSGAPGTDLPARSTAPLWGHLVPASWGALEVAWAGGVVPSAGWD